MAKKQAARERDAGKTRFELRFDDELYAQTKQLADDAGVSINQLIQGLTRWFVDRAHVGEPYRDERGYVRDRPQEGCLWAGEKGEYYSDDIRQAMAMDHGGSLDNVPEGDHGKISIFLDFTERRVVRDDV